MKILKYNFISLVQGLFLFTYVISHAEIHITFPKEVSDKFGNITTVESDEGTWTTYSYNDGVHDDDIRGVDADPKGGVWAGTRYGGVSYFDGNLWTTYNTSNSGIESNDIITIVRDHNDVLWFGSGDRHITSYDGEKWIIHYDSPQRIHNMVVDQNNVKWIASNGDGLGKYNDITMEIFNRTNSLVRNDIPVGLTVDKYNDLWVGYYFEHGISKITGDKWTTYLELGDYPVYGITAMGIDSKGAVWMASNANEYGVWCYDENNGTTYYDSSHLISTTVWNLAVDNNDVVWFVCSGGVTSFDGVIWRHYTAQNSGLPNNIVVDVTVDSNNVKWFATKGGVSSFDYQSGPYVLIESPNGNERWETGSTHKIRWKAKNVETVKIEYSSDGGTNWKVLAENLDASIGSYEWTVPDIDSSEYIVKITDVTDSERNDTSNNVFTVSNPFVTILFPNNAETLETNIYYTVQWDHLGIDTLKLEYSMDNGENWIMIADNIDASSESFLWKVPDEITNSGLIRLTDTLDNSVYDFNDKPFSVNQSFIVIESPNGGETFESKQRFEIVWDASSGISNVRIEVFHDDGLTWTEITSSVPASDKSFSWRIPNVQSNQSLIRISDTLNPDLFDVCDSHFSIELSNELWTIYTTEDGLGDNWIRGVDADPRGGVWAGTYRGGVSYFNGNSWTTYNTSNSGIESNDIIATAVDRNNVLWFGAGDGHLTSFDGENWKIYTDSPKRIHNIVIDNNNVKWIASNGDGLGKYDDVSMKILNISNSPMINDVPVGLAIDHDNALWTGYYGEIGVTKLYDDIWTIYPHFDHNTLFSVTAMDIDSGGVKWMASNWEQYGVWSYHETNCTTYYEPENLVSGIVWDLAVDYDNIVWFACDGGVTSFDGSIWRHYTTENSGLAHDTVIDVTVDTNNVKWFATVDGLSSFEYLANDYVRVISPNGKELWETGTSHNITWISKDVEYLTIEYSADGGVNWILIANNVDAATGLYQWTWPDVESSQYLVRLTDASDPEISDVSNTVFTISPPFVRITSPNGNEEIPGMKNYPISWQSTGIKNTKLELSTDSGNSWITITDNIDASTGSYIWDVPDIESLECLLRITAIDDSEITDNTDYIFTIFRPYLHILSPNGGEEWISEKTHEITWESKGVDKINVEYSVDGGLSWNLLKSRYDASKDYSIWHPLDVESMLCMVRISDVDNKNITDESDDVFHIYVITSVDDTIPHEFAVFQNSPNPFNPSTTINFDLPETDNVTIEIYNISGQKITTLADRNFDAGSHTIIWNGSDYSAGLYIYKITTGNFSQTRKMLLLR